MKKTDIAMIILIATVCVLGAFFITNAVVGSPASDTVKVKTIEKIDATITPPDTAISNQNAINPAVKVQVNDGTQQ